MSEREEKTIFYLEPSPIMSWRGCLCCLPIEAPQNPPVKLAHGNRTTTTHIPAPTPFLPRSYPPPPRPPPPLSRSPPPPFTVIPILPKSQSETGFFHICVEKTGEGCTQKRFPPSPQKKKCGGGGGGGGG